MSDSIVMQTSHAHEGLHGFRPYLWLLLLPLIGLAGYLGLILSLGTAHPFEVTVGQSMEPMLHTGDLAVMQGLGPSGVELGDVVALSVHEADRERFGYSDRVLHRVIDITNEDGRLLVVTKGDNQELPDPFTTPASEIDSELKFSLPKLGYFLFYLHSTQGKIALGGLLLLFLLYEGVRWVTDTAEELIEEGEPVSPYVAAVPPGTGLDEFTGAIAEYGVHLRSHTRVVQGLGDTTDELRESALMQREVIGELRDSVRLLAERIGATTASSVLDVRAPQPAGTETAVGPARTATPELARVLARPILFADVLNWRIAPLVLHVRGFSAQDELLRFGDALDNDPWTSAVSMETIAGDDAVFALETCDTNASLERIRRLTDFSVHVINPRVSRSA